MNKILIVDDEPVILTVLKGILAKPDREFVCAETAAQALSLAGQAASLEVALVDKNLPDRTGLEVARELKHLHPDVEVILLTGYASLDSAIEAVKVGAFDYIQKPIEDFDDLSLKVQNAAEKVRLKREQRRLLDRFAESEERYRGVFQASSDAILVYDSDLGRVHDANLAAVKLYGYPREELVALTVDRLGVRVPVGGPGEPATQRHRRKDGSAFPVEVAFGQFLFQRRAMRIVAVRDVTERERAEKERRALEEQVRHAQKMEAMGRLAGGVAHDFNNVLTVVCGNAELLVGDGPADADRVRERAREILDAARRGASLSRQLLDLSRKKATRREPLDLNAVVTDLQKMLRRTLGEDLELLVSQESDLGRAMADADQMGQVLLNLALNARDALAGKRQGKLVIETHNADLLDPAGTFQAGLPAGRYVMLAVSDNGCGMGPEVKERLFEPFFTTKEPGKGTGLGLATVYAIVQQAGGTVRAYSEPGVGTTFKVYLPRVDDAAPKSVPAPQPPPRRGRGETVLVVEDDDAVRALVRRVLTRHGYVVLEGSGGREALAAARAPAGPVDLLVSDLVMPQMSGRDLAETLAAERPGLAVLFMSAYAEYAVLQHGLVANRDSFVAKPFTEEVLLRQIARTLDARPAAPTPSAGT